VEKFLDNTKIVEISKKRTIQLKILEILGGKLNRVKIPGKKLPKIWV